MISSVILRMVLYVSENASLVTVNSALLPKLKIVSLINYAHLIKCIQSQSVILKLAHKTTNAQETFFARETFAQAQFFQTMVKTKSR
jgi:hypothetical protein